MTGHVSRTLLLGLALPLLACGASNGRAPLDGAAGHADGAAGSTGGSGGPTAGGGGGPGDGTCLGSPIECVPGGPVDNGVVCTSGGPIVSGYCFEGQWICGPGTIPAADCPCVERGLVCPGAACTPQGWVCPDAGTDADAGHDAPADGAGDGGVDGYPGDPSVEAPRG